MAKIQIALATDMMGLKPTLTSMMSALEAASRPVTVHFLGFGLSGEARDLLARAVACWPDADLRYHDLAGAFTEVWERFPWNGRHSPVRFAIVQIPGLVGGGRVLYLDSDTLVHADVSPLFDTDMNGCHIGAVRDYGYLATWAGLVPGTDPDPSRPNREAMSPYPFCDYVNTGVVLFDNDSICADPELLRTLSDPRDLLCDGKRIARCMKGRTLLLDPSWNAISGIYNRYAEAHQAMIGDADPFLQNPPRISHYIGAVKPWHEFDLAVLRHPNAAKVRQDLHDLLNFSAHEMGVDYVLGDLDGAACFVEYESSVSIYRRARSRYMNMIEG